MLAVYLLQRIPPAKWLAINVILWGIATVCVAATTNTSTLLTARVFLGIFEATSIPSINTITAQWYTKVEAAPRYAFWSLGGGGAQILGGLISFAFQNVSSGTLNSWKIMFLVSGTFTIFVGIATVYTVPDTPMQAAFLSDTEKVSLLTHIAVNKTGIRDHRFRAKDIWEAIRDSQVWLLVLTATCVSDGFPFVSIL